MKGYIKALRLPVCIMGGTLVLVGYRLAHLPFSGHVWLQAIFSFLCMSVTMAWNDWRDRNHDAKKGKTFALESGRRYFVFVMAVLVIAITFGVIISLGGLKETVLVLAGLAVGLIYSEVRKWWIAPNLWVAVGSALPILFAPVYRNVFLLFLATACSIYAREILKDFEDIEVDEGYKGTLIQRAGKLSAMKVAAGTFFLSAIPLLAISGAGQVTQMVAALNCSAATVFLLNLGTPSVFGYANRAAKNFLDIRVALYMIAILVHWAP